MGCIFLAKFEQRLPFRLVLLRFCFELRTVWAIVRLLPWKLSVFFFFKVKSQRPLSIPATGINILAAQQEGARLAGEAVTAPL